MGPTGMNALGAMLREAGQGIGLYQDLSRQRKFDKLKFDQAEMEERRQQQQMALLRQQMENEQLQQQALQNALNQEPKKQARGDFEALIGTVGVEGALDSPEGVRLAETAGIPLRRQPMMPKDMQLAGVDTPVGPIDGGTLTDVYRKKEAKLAFPNTGVAKPPKIQAEETERELASTRAKGIMDLLNGLSTGAAQSVASTPEEVKRLKLKLGLGVDPTSIYGPIRETPEESAAKAKADAKARLPYQKQLIEYAIQQRGADGGDPYFNAALTAVMSIFPPMSQEMADKAVEAALQMAQRAQGAVPRGAPPARVPPPPPQTADSLIDQGLKQFGSYDELLKASSNPAVQQKLKQAGIDPVTYTRRITARKIADALANMGKK